MENTNGQVRGRGPERILVAATLAAVAMLGCSDEDGGNLNPTAPSAVNAPTTASSASAVASVATPTSAGAEAASSGDQITADSSMTLTQGLNAVAIRTPLTANFVLVPSDHDGSAFTVQLHFSEPIGNKPRHVKEAFSQPRMVGQPAAGGSVTKAKRLDRAWVSGKRVTSQWELTVEPSGSGDVELRAAGNLVCSGGSALCTHPGRQSLSHDLSATIRDGTASSHGPRPGQTNPPGRVRNARAELVGRSGTNYLIYFEDPHDTDNADGALEYEIQVGGCHPRDTVHRRITVTGWGNYYYRVITAGTTAAGNPPATAYFGVQGINRNGRGPCERVETVLPPLADLVVPSASVNDNTLGTGDSFTLSVMVGNDGPGIFEGRPLLLYYRSNNATVNASDTEVGAGRTIEQKQIGALFAGQTRSHSIRLTAPSAAGTYYYGACLSRHSSFESDATNNCSGSESVQVVVN